MATKAEIEKNVSEYLPADEYLIVNDDPDLTPIKILLPEPPEDKTRIAGYGLPRSEQKWRPPELPPKLKSLQKSSSNIDEVWGTLDKNRDYYRDEINFIKKQWYHRLHGYWFYNNGKPTYIDGWQYFYCGWWEIDIGLPKYRDRDRKFFLAARHFYNDTTAYYRFRIIVNRSFWGNKKEYAYFSTRKQAERYMRENDLTSNIQPGDYYIDQGKRICFGFLYPKHRREGATYKAECINYEIISRTLQANGGIQSMDEDSAKKTFDKMVSPWKKLPFFFRPLWEGTTSPKQVLSFNPPPTRVSMGGGQANIQYGLEGYIDFRSSSIGAYDGEKLHFLHNDEIGKTTATDIHKRWLVQKKCLSTGAGENIIGYTIGTSTVGEMEKSGGNQFARLVKMSKFDHRNANGQTLSGMYVLFIPATEGLEGFIDEFGNSVIDNPKEPVRGESGLLIHRGSKEYLMNYRQGLEEGEEHEALAEEIRQAPIRLRECFRGAAKQSGFNIAKLDNRLDQLVLHNPYKVQGNFYWANGKDSRVEFNPDPNGRFFLSLRLKQNESNRRYYDNMIQSWVPMNTHRFIAGADPFKFTDTEGYRKSHGGGAVFHKKDKKFDANKTVGEVMSERFVCSYKYRPTTKYEYGEDMLMMCVYFGCQMFPEINVSLVWDHFENRGYSGYLYFKYDIKTGKYSKTPGGYTREEIKQDIFTEYMGHIEKNIEREVHDDILQECRDIDSPKELTKYDLFTAGGYALIGARESRIEDDLEEMDETFNLEDYIDVYRN